MRVVGEGLLRETAPQTQSRPQSGTGLGRRSLFGPTLLAGLADALTGGGVSRAQIETVLAELDYYAATPGRGLDASDIMFLPRLRLLCVNRLCRAVAFHPGVEVRDSHGLFERGHLLDDFAKGALCRGRGFAGATVPADRHAAQNRRFLMVAGFSSNLPSSGYAVASDPPPKLTR